MKGVENSTKTGDGMINVIFDMDGTLLDTQRICIDAWEIVGQSHGISGMGADIPIVCGMNRQGWCKYLEDKYEGLDTERFSDEVREYVLENQVVRFKKGAPELLAFLEEHGIKKAIASGTSRAGIKRNLEAVNAEGRFDVVVGGADVPNGKPAPDIFLLACEKLGAKPEDCIVLEDSSNGVRAAVAAGARCIGIPDVAQFSDEVKGLLFAECESMLDVIPIIEKLI